jgi:selenocysteine lyase/cysteine desulfurase
MRRQDPREGHLMPLSRRDFLATTGWSLLAGATSACRNPPLSDGAATADVPSLADWNWVRGQFRLSPDYLHLSQFYIVSHPRPVREAIERYRQALDANPFVTVERGMFGSPEENLPRRSLEAAAGYLGGKAEEIALVDSTTQGLALVYNGLPLKPGHEILMTTHDHYAQHESARLAAEKLGATARRVPLYARPDAMSTDEVTENLRRAIRRETRVVGLTWVHSSTGVKLPVAALAQVVAQANRSRPESRRILLVVDGVHGFGNQDESPVHMGIDFFVAGTHKWIFAPRGTGIVWAPAANWALLRPTVPTFYGRQAYQAWMDDKPAGPTQASFVSPGGFKAYEHQWAMAEAFAFHQLIGRRRIADRIAALNDQCKEGLAQMPRVTLHTPRGRDRSAGIICFEVAGLAPETVVKRLLERKVIASRSPYKVSYARLAPSLVNDEREVDAALRAVRELAA